MKKQKEAVFSNTKIAVIFFVFLAFIAAVSIIFKVIAVIRVSRFDSSRRFNLSVTNGKNVEVISLSPVSKNIVIFKLNDGVRLAEAGRFLEIPIDGFITHDSLALNKGLNALFLSAIYNYKKLDTNITIIDLLRVAILTKTIPDSGIDIRTIGSDTSGSELDKIVSRLVNDSLIEKDNQTIQIINGTGVSGFGNRLARLVTNMGGDVIIVATSEILNDRSTISYIGKKNYTVEKLQKVLGYEVKKELGNAISDITITMGKDRVNSAPF
jgi:hypothetical protein